MPKYRLEDLDEILAKSQRLTSTIADASQPSKQFRYRVGELDEVSRQLADGAKTVSGIIGSTANYEAKRVLDDINNIVLKGVDDRPVGVEGIDLDSYLDHHHDMIIFTAIQSSKQISEDFMNGMQRKWLLNEWDAAKVQLAERVGHRPLGKKPTAPTPLLLDYTTPQRSALRDSNIPNIIYVHSEIVEHMCRIEHSQEGQQTCPPFTMRLLDELDKYSSDITIGEANNKKLLLSRSDIVGYKTCLDLLSHMLGEHQHLHAKQSPFNKPAFFSPICFDRIMMSNEKLAQERHTILTYGCLSYYNEIALNLYSQRHSSLGQRDPGQSMRSMIKAHVQSLDISHSNIYTFIYYALRAGEYQAALDEINEYNGHVHNKAMEVDSNISHLLNAIIILLNHFIASNNTNHSTPSKMGASALASIGNLEGALNSIQKLYQHEEARYLNNQPADPYKLFVLNLLGIVDKSYYSSGYDINSYVLEDFVWSYIFTILLKRLYTGHTDSQVTLAFTSPLVQKMALVPTGNDSSSKYVSEHEEFLELIYSYGGADYFDPNHSNVFKYALLLFSCHRFGDAIDYLHSHNKSFAATHLCLLASYYGLILPYQDLLSNPSLTIVRTYSGSNLASSPWSVVGSYVKTLLFPLKAFTQDENRKKIVMMACDYVLSLHNNVFSTYCYHLSGDMKDKVKVTYHRFISQVLQEYIFSMTSEETIFLLGSVELQNKSNPKTYIDNYLSAEEKRNLLQNVAYVYIQSYHDVESGISFLLLSQHYRESLIELCNLLVHQITLLQSNVNVSDHFDYWLQYANNFKAKYLEADNSVLSFLSSSADGSKLLSVFSCLISFSVGLRVLLTRRQAAEAWERLSSFMPENRARDASPSLALVFTTSILRPIADLVLLALARCVSANYAECKQTQYVKNDMYMQCEAKLKEMKEAATSLLGFVDKNKEFLTAPDRTKQEMTSMFQAMV